MTIRCLSPSQDFYQPSIHSARLGFDFGSIFPDFTRLTPANWPLCLRALHEYAHHYQFTTTSYGVLTSVYTASRAVLLQSLLAESCWQGVPIRRPLAKMPPVAFEGPNALAAAQECLSELDRSIAVLAGVEPGRPQIIEMRGHATKLASFLSTTFGMKNLRLAASRDHDMPRMSIRDVLESHAHTLSTLWAVTAAREQDLQEEVEQEILTYYQSTAHDVYRQFVQFAPRDDIIWPLWSYCAFCELALNAPLFDHWGRGLNAEVVVLDEPSWSPSYRMWRLLQLVGERGFPEALSSDDPGWMGVWIERLASHLDLDEQWFSHADDNLAATRLFIQGMVGIVTRSEAAQGIIWSQLDALGIALNAHDVRRTFGLTLAGGIDRLRSILLATAGGPTIVSAPGSRFPIHRRPFMGLHVLGIDRHDLESEEWTDIVVQGIREDHAVRRLLDYAAGDEESARLSDQLDEDIVRQLIESLPYPVPIS